MGIYPSIENLDISKRNIFHMYGDPPAIIKAQFENGVYCDIYIGDLAEVFAVIFNKDGANVASKMFARQLKLKPIHILPQIGPLLRKEQPLKITTVQKNLDTYLSSRHFRNQLHYYNPYFERFKQLAERTWKGLQIKDLSYPSSENDGFSLYIRDQAFTAEIGWMGHGLQMWLQTIWFLSRCSKDSTVILDEPDVYMHADLQRRLIRLIKNEFKQIMIATHSIEIMSEVEAENILPIDNTKAKISYANKLPIVQKIIDNIGSVHNIDVARIFSYKKFLIVEGDKDDVKILSIFQSKIFPSTFEPFDILPKTFVGGWGGWQRVIGSHKVFKDNKSQLTTFCIFDSDYHTEKEKSDRLKEAKELDMNVHIWSKKEIENFVLVPSCILRTIEKGKKSSNQVTLKDVEDKLAEICDELKQEVVDNYATEIQNREKEISTKTANQRARIVVDEYWNQQKFSIIPGKDAISKLSAWTNQVFKFNLSSYKLARELYLTELDSEIVKLVTCIENNTGF